MFDFKTIFSFLLLTGFAGKSRSLAHSLSAQRFSEHVYNGSVSEGAAEVELSVVEGRDLTVFTTTVLSEEDPQILTSRLHGSSEDLIAQMSCYSNNCTNECSGPVLIRFDAQNVTIVLVNATRNQTGRYKVYVHCGTRNDIWMYVITVLESTLRKTESQPSPSSMTSKPVIAGISAAVVLLILSIIVVIIVIRYKKRRKETFQSVPTEVP